LYIDEVFVKIDGKQQYLWRAVDQDGEIVDVFLQVRRDGVAAERGVVVSYETIQCDGAAAKRFFRQRAFASWNNVVVI
jgi:hypothetical protein